MLFNSWSNHCPEKTPGHWHRRTSTWKICKKYFEKIIMRMNNCIGGSNIRKVRECWQGDLAGDGILCDLAWWQGVTNQVWGDKQQLHSGRCGGTLEAPPLPSIVQLQGGSYPHQHQHHTKQITGITLGTFIQFPNWVKHRTIFVSRSGADDTDWIWKHCQIWQQ